MIMDRPELVKYFASRNPVQLLLFVTPLWVLSLMFMSQSLASLAVLIGAFLSGCLYWTFLEYAIHRWAYHTPYRSKFLYYFLGSFHLYHHKDMSDRRVYNAGFLMIYFLAPTVLSPVLLVTRDPGILGALTLGLSGSYYFYEWVHFILHYKVHTSGYLSYIQKYHFHHHDKSPQKNFGNTSHLWDYLLGTYDEKYKDYVMPVSSEQTLITSRKVIHAEL